MDSKKDRKTSDMWEYFKSPILKNGKQFTVCMLCNTEIAYHGGTSSMRSNLTRRHPSKAKSSGQIGVLVGRKTTLTSAWTRTPMSSQMYEKHTYNLALMCALDARPISICQGVGFKNFVKGLNPEYQVPSRPTVIKYPHKIYAEAKQEVVTQMRNQSVSLTCDICTSTALDGYLGVMGHYIDNIWVMHNENISTKAMSDRHNGVNIARAISDVINDFSIKNIPYLLMDNASNMCVAAREAKVAHAGCFAHSLQLCVEDCLKLNQISRALGAVRKLVGHFNHSVVSTQALLQKLTKDAGSKPLMFIQDVNTRWNSSYTMAQRLLLLRVPVFAVLYDDSVTKASERSVLDMTNANWKVLETVLLVLEPFVQATEILTKEDTPTGSHVFVLINSLFSTLDDDESDTVTCRDLKTKIKQGMIRRFSVDHDGLPNDEALESSPLVLALALDPRYKSLKFLTPSKREIVKARIKSLLEKEMQNMEKSNAIVKLKEMTCQRKGKRSLIVWY